MNCRKKAKNLTIFQAIPIEPIEKTAGCRGEIGWVIKIKKAPLKIATDSGVVMLLNGGELTAVKSADGTVLQEYEYKYTYSETGLITIEIESADGTITTYSYSGEILQNSEIRNPAEGWIRMIDFDTLLQKYAEELGAAGESQQIVLRHSTSTYSYL